MNRNHKTPNATHAAVLPFNFGKLPLTSADNLIMNLLILNRKYFLKTLENQKHLSIFTTRTFNLYEKYMRVRTQVLTFIKPLLQS